MEKLTYQEEEAMLAIWRTGESNIKSFMENITDPPPYTTVASTVKTWKRRDISSAAPPVTLISIKP